MNLKIAELGISFLGIALSMPQLVASHPIIIDGDFSDWDAVPIAYLDVIGDGAQEDFAELRVTNDDDYVFLYFRVASPEFVAQLANGNALGLYIDTDNDAGTGLAVHGIGAEFEWVFGGRRGNYHHSSGTTIVFAGDVSWHLLPTHSSQAFEVAISRTSDPMTLSGAQTPGTLKIVMRSSPEDDFMPDDPGGVTFTIDPTLIGPAIPIQLARNQPGDLRILSYNTLTSGLSNATREVNHERILKAVDPDIMVFQEQNNRSGVMANLNAWFPGDTLTVIQLSGSNMIASKFPILNSAQFIASGLCSAILIDTEAVLGVQTLVLNTHLTFASDASRQRDADEIISALKDLRAGNGPFAVPEGTAIVHVGDFNLFGSSQVLTTSRDGDIVDEATYGPDSPPDWDGTSFVNLISRHTGARWGHTTSGTGGMGTPSKLDYVFYSDSVVAPANHYILSTPEMSASDLAANGLDAQDTVLASDHLPRVLDLVLLDTGPLSIRSFELIGGEVQITGFDPVATRIRSVWTSSDLVNWSEVPGIVWTDVGAREFETTFPALPSPAFFRIHATDP